VVGIDRLTVRRFEGGELRGRTRPRARGVVRIGERVPEAASCRPARNARRRPRRIWAVVREPLCRQRCDAWRREARDRRRAIDSSLPAQSQSVGQVMKQPL